METAPSIVRKVSIPDTLLAIPAGTSRQFRARSFAPYGSVRSAISRLNAKHSFPVFEATTNDNGETFIVSRK